MKSPKKDFVVTTKKFCNNVATENENRVCLKQKNRPRGVKGRRGETCSRREGGKRGAWARWWRSINDLVVRLIYNRLICVVNIELLT